MLGVVRHGPGDAAVRGFRVEFTSDGRTGEAVIDWGIVLCDEGSGADCGRPELLPEL